MNKESFQDTIRQQYAAEIISAYQTCAHKVGEVIDIPALNAKLGELMHSAKLDGLARKDFAELVRTLLPGHVEKLDFYPFSQPHHPKKKKAA